MESLTRRLAETPEDFLGEPRIGGNGQVHVAAVVNDLLHLLGTTTTASELMELFASDRNKHRNRHGVTLLLCWLLADDWFRHERLDAEVVVKLLSEGATELAAVASNKFVTDPDRREELSRFALDRLGFRPAGESEAQSQDRLLSLSSAERVRVMKASREAELRAKAIREALAKKAAQESADKWTRE